LTAEHYGDAVAANPRIDALREKMTCVEDPQYSRDYLDPEKRSIANAVQVFFKNGTQTEVAEVQYPVGHRRRRHEALTLLKEKFRVNLTGHFPAKQVSAILNLFYNTEGLDVMPVHALVDLFVI
jgi:2-methylcitrate dehydratase PrpD